MVHKYITDPVPGDPLRNAIAITVASLLLYVTPDMVLAKAVPSVTTAPVH